MQEETPKLAKKRTCQICGKKFKTIHSRKQHVRNYHHGMNRVSAEPSVATQMIDAQIDIAMGDSAPDWLIDMMD